MDEANILEINNIEDHDGFFGVKNRNPMISVIDMSKLGHIKHVPKRIGIYAIMCHIYPQEQTSDDTIASTITFYSPGQYGRYNSGYTDNPQGWVLAIDIKPSDDTTITNRINELSYFTEQSGKLIHLNKDETNMIVNCMNSLDRELDHPKDAYTTNILHHGLAVLANICQRYYDNHNSAGNENNKNIINRVNGYLDNYLRRPSVNKELPTVTLIAQALNITPNYLGDLIRKHTQHSAHDHIRRFILREAQHQLQYSRSSINDIAYNMGYKYPHHFTRVFKSTYGMTPSEYRAKHKP